MFSDIDKQFFTELLCDADQMTESNILLLKSISDKYPWYPLPSVILMKHYTNNKGIYNKIASSISLNLLANSYFNVLNGLMSYSEQKEEISNGDVIDKFLKKSSSEIKIKPSQDVHNKDVAGDYEDYEMLEDMAKRLAVMGLKKEALEIYNKLYLKIPEKSVYFAKIIECLKNE